MSGIAQVGVDSARRVIEVHAVDAAEKLVTNRPLLRDKFMIWCGQLALGCLIAMEVSSGVNDAICRPGGMSRHIKCLTVADDFSHECVDD